MGSVELRVLGRFRRFVARPHMTVEIREGDTVQTLIDRLGLPGDAPDLWVLVDHVPAKRDHPLKADQVVTLFQPIAGG